MKFPLPPLQNCNIAVIGLGYVGLPLAVELSQRQTCSLTNTKLRRHVIAFDINTTRLEELSSGFDRTNEIQSDTLNSLQSLNFTSDIEILSQADVFIVTVPTPVDNAKTPDLSPLRSASTTVGKSLALRSARLLRENIPYSSPVIVFESTVYPGATEEVCVPIIENSSGLQYNRDFFVGYSPERINPGDNDHKLVSIVKVTSGSSPESADWIDMFYGSIIEAGTHKASSIKVAEAAKVIENTQRDLNIALVNELAIIFNLLEIDTLDVLEAAGTKWNFLPFRPGLVGGHCIGVDPYYLTYKAQQLGYYPEVVLAGRRINDGMSNWVVDQVVLEFARKGRIIANSIVLVLGLTFKENCPDLRNTRVVDLIRSLKRFGMVPVVVDPFVDSTEAKTLYGIDVYNDIPLSLALDAVILAVAHQQFTQIDTSCWIDMSNSGTLLFDLKGLIPRDVDTIRL